MTSQDLIDHYKLNVSIYADHTRDLPYTRKSASERKWWRIKKLGQGGYGTVWLEREENTSSERAVKGILKKTTAGPSIDFTKELLAMAKFSKFQDTFVHFHGWYESVDTVFLAMEYFEHGDLHNYLTPRLPENEARSITAQLLDGLAVMHEHKFTHRDLKPENIFVVERAPKWWVKIGDFGITKRIESEHTALRTQAGTQQFQAPEILGCTEESEESSEYTDAVDIWSLGCVTYAMLTSQLPFPLIGNIVNFSQGTANFPVGNLKKCEVSEEGIAFIQKLISPRATDRLDAKTALQSSWIIAIDGTEEPTNRPSLLTSSALPELVTRERSSESTAISKSNSEAANHELSSRTESPALSLEPTVQSWERSLAHRSMPSTAISPERGLNGGVVSNRNGSPLHFEITDDQMGARNGLTDTGEPEKETMIQDITPLHVAAHDGDRGAAELLVDAGTLKNARTSQQATPLHFAAQEGHEAIVQLLLNTEIAINGQTDKGYTALHLAAQTGQAAVIEVLVRHRADIEARENRQWTPLHMAAQDGQIDALEVLLEVGADKEARTSTEDSNMTPMHLAAYRGHRMAVQCLLQRGAQKVAESVTGHTALHLAAQEGHDAVVLLLLENKVPVDCGTKKGFTPFHLAAQNGHVSVLRTLLTHGANIEARDELKWTPLHLAAQENQTHALEYLLDRSANSEARTGQGLTPLDIAAYKGHQGAVQLLLHPKT